MSTNQAGLSNDGGKAEEAEPPESLDEIVRELRDLSGRGNDVLDRLEEYVRTHSL